MMLWSALSASRSERGSRRRPSGEGAPPPLARPVRVALVLTVATIVSLNVFAKIEARPQGGDPSITSIVYDEGTSAVVAIALLMSAWPLLRRLHRWQTTPRARALGLAALGLALALLHVLGFKGLRVLASPVVGLPASHDLAENFGLETAKDLAFYALMIGSLFAAPHRLRAAVFDAPPAPSPPPAIAVIRDTDGLLDLPDGRRRLRVRACDIVAVSSAGNYAEVRLADGRCPLLRATLSSLEPQLACRELVRVHRSWIVNPRHVTAIETLPSGDRRLTLAGGRTAPASRRYLEAINRVVGACEALGGAVA